MEKKPGRKMRASYVQSGSSGLSDLVLICSFSGFVLCLVYYVGYWFYNGIWPHVTLMTLFGNELYLWVEDLARWPGLGKVGVAFANFPLPLTILLSGILLSIVAYMLDS